MKILCAEYNAKNRVAVVPIGDNALLRNNDDFYIPEFAAGLSAVPQLVVRISKLGKSVGERFAGRYYEEIGVGIRFYADGFERELQTAGLSTAMASSFDGSAAISGLLPKGIGEEEYDFRVNGETVFRGRVGDLPLSIERLIAVASEYHTLKIGDFLYLGNRFRYRTLKREDRLQIYFRGKEQMNFKLK